MDTRSNSWPRSRRSSKRATCSSMESFLRRRSSKSFLTLLTYHSMLHEDMRHFFDGFPSNAHPMAILSSMVSALSAYYPDSIEPDLTQSGAHCASAFEAPDDRRVQLSEEAGPAGRVSEEQPRLLWELPIHDVLAPRRADLFAGPRAREGAQRPDDSPRGSRTELLDVDGSPGRFEPSKPICGNQRGRFRAVGPATWRRQPSRHRDAQRDPRRRRRLQGRSWNT